MSSAGGWIATISAAAIFIRIAAIVMGLMFIPAMSWLYPDPAKASAVVFLTGLFGTCFLTIGIGYPLALNTGGFIADCCTKGEPLPLTDLDRSLAAKIRKQVSA